MTNASRALKSLKTTRGLITALLALIMIVGNIAGSL
jgi:hypothetical protein